MSDLLAQLGSAVGPEHVTPATGGLSVQGVAPNFVVSPGSAEELADAMKIAATARAAVVPWGGGTRATAWHSAGGARSARLSWCARAG